MLLQDSNRFVMRELKGAELLAVYGKYGVLHFPADELKPVERIQHLMDAGIYYGYGLFCQTDDAPSECLMGYACLIRLPGHDTMLLDYYAILEEYRSHGIGSVFMEHLKKQNPHIHGIFMETENPDFAANEEERLIRNKRNDFYVRNGARFTSMLSTLFGVRYKVLYMPFAKDHEDDFLYEELHEIYVNMFSAKHYATQVCLTKPQTLQ